MVQRILVPCDGTERCAPALAAALELARQSGATVVGLLADPAAAPQPEPPADQDPLHADRHAGIALAHDAQAYLQRCADEQGVARETVACAAPEDVECIVAAARARRCDLIVLAADRHPGLIDRLSGGAPCRVMQRCGIPVLMVPAPDAPPTPLV
jgi:nucleotide-binding universal stress UspA family protein